MKTSNQIRRVFKTTLFTSFTAVLFLSVIAFTGCTENDDPVDANGGSAKVAGKVTDSDGFNKLAKTSGTVEGASVILARVKADGALETVSKNEVTTDADGKFLIETDVNGEADLVIVAKKGNKEWKGIVTSKVRTGITVYSQPLNEETTAEVHIYTKAKAQGYNNVSYTDIAAYINATAAAEIKNNTNAAAKIAASLKAKADVHARTVSNSSFGGSNEKWNLILAGSTDAQASLERDLFYAESEAAEEAAFNAYFKALVNAYVNAGLSADACFRATEISQKVYLNNISSLSAGAQLELKKRAAVVKARILSSAVNFRFTAMGASNAQLNALSTAGLNLSAALKNASGESQIKAAFDTYNSVILNELKVSLGSQASLLSSTETKIADFKNSLQAVVRGSVSNDSLIDAYINFCTNVEAEVGTVLSAAGKNNVDAAASILILVNINS
ncbi:MAG: hypothetical protein R6W90_11720 [Ignavibacteriaceae bacterium]